MSNAGYTATEALAALAIIGLAIGGLTSGMQVIGRVQSTETSALGRADAIRTAGRDLEQLLAERGPYRSDDVNGLQGDGEAFSFPCGTALCGARIDGQSLKLTRSDGTSTSVAFPNAAGLHFSYNGALGTGGVWPPAPLPPPAPQWQGLLSIALVAGDRVAASPITVTHLWVQQAANCDFDSITQDCRAVAQ